ncbi:ArsR/SmtB family transcription factor [Actinokineospora inagensis]|uniref:ArsR/SmtB family transcription factor n=1 Tax=Actinokineospora inagensis TaxID=103730 RepID=UPI0003FFAF3F|nr:winged helix-turn-helix domain-containing protein [Actinokineospora inagensis]
MLRVRLSADDLATVRVLPTIGPFAETVASVQVLRDRGVGPVLGAWRRQVLAEGGASLRGLGLVVPGREPGLDLVRLAGPTVCLYEGIERVLAAPSDVGAAGFARSAWVRELPSGVATRSRLLEHLARYYFAALAPVWDRVQARMDAERALSAEALVEGGVGALLSSLHPDIGWSAPWLRIAGVPGGEVRLNGRGLLVAPSLFLRRPSWLMCDCEGKPGVLIYPARLDDVDPTAILPGARPPDTADKGLGALLGATRARLLTAIGDGLTVPAALARTASVSTAAVSQHARVLREAGLVVTSKHPGGVRHTITQRGLSLLGRGQ